MDKVLITGVTGMMGSHLADLFLEKDYEVHGLVRRSSTKHTSNIDHINNDNFKVIEGDLVDPSSIRIIIDDLQPEYVINCAAQSHVHTSFNQPSYTFEVNTIGVLNILEAIKQTSKHTKLLTFSTSEMFGNNYKADYYGNKIQDEGVEFIPRSPYGVSKLAAHNLIKVYRESYNLFASAIIMFNSEGPRRGPNFVTRKITLWLANLYHKYNLGALFPSYFPQISENEKLRLGNLSAYRDWSYAGDTARAAYQIITNNTPEDFVVCSGETHTIEDFLTVAFGCIHKDLDYHDYVIIDPSLYRPAEVDYLCGSSWKIRQKLGWKPTVGFEELVRLMVNSDIELLRNKYPFCENADA